jgi:hypothetical protein
VNKHTSADVLGQSSSDEGERARVGQAHHVNDSDATSWTDGCLIPLALNRLTREDLRNLERFAEIRLAKVGLPVSASEDLVQRAVFRVIKGATGRAGRHPKPSDLCNHGAFLSYLRGVINSQADTQRELVENRFIHETWADGAACGSSNEIQAAGSVDQDVAFRDIVDHLYHRLRSRAPTRLRRILKAWKNQQFDTDNIPLQGCHRRLRAELRALAVEVMNELLC